MTEQKAFLQKVIDQSDLKSTNDAQSATEVLFRILRDMIPNEDVQKIEQELQTAATKGNTQVAELWTDPNVMVAFFSRVSPLRTLKISYGTAMLRLQQEAALPEGIKSEQVAIAIFSATKAELSDERIQDVANCLSDDGLRQMWKQA